VNPWLFDGKPLLTVPPDAFGFVYRITDTVTSRSYIGKKQFNSYTSRKVPGKRNRKHTVKESDWQTYISSCDELKEAIKTYGDQRFIREVLVLCPTKADLTYTEVALQFKFDVLNAKLPDGSPAFWNRNILNKFFATRPVNFPKTSVV
jgi:hypothetical protein